MKEVKIILDDNNELQFPIDKYSIDDKFIHLTYNDKDNKMRSYGLIPLCKIKAFIFNESGV